MRTRTPTRLRHGRARGRCACRRPLPTGHERSGQLLAEGHARPMEPGFHGSDRLTDQLGDLLVRELFDVPEGQHRPVALGQRVERPFQRLARLTREKLTLRILRPVRQQERAVALAVAVLLERRQVLLERGLELMPLAAPLVESRVRRDPVDPAPEGRASRERGALRRDRQEDVLDNLLRGALIPRDAEGEPIDARGVLAHQRLERRGVATLEPLDEPRLLAHRHPRARSCSATNAEQSSATPRWESMQSSSSPVGSTKATSERSSASPLPSTSARSHASRSSATQGPITRPSTLSLGHPFAVLIDSILSIWRDSTLTCRKSRAVRGRRGILVWSALCRSVRRPASKFRGERSERTVLRPRNFVVSLAKPGAWSSRSVQLLADGPRGSSLRRRIRSFSIRLRSVLGWSLRIFAAPRAPSMTHPACFRAERMWLRSTSSSTASRPADAGAGAARTAGIGRPRVPSSTPGPVEGRSSGPSSRVGPGDSTTPRSTMFWSSRMFPGHA